jgi:hypothetical protein
MNENKNLPKNFNSEVYLEINPDVAAAKVDPVQHYLTYGIKEGRQYTYFSQADCIENEYSNKFSFLKPRQIPNSAWIGHIYFVNYLISIIKPKIFVELGIHYGFSYYNICRTLQILKQEDEDFITSKAFGFDWFKGDQHVKIDETDEINIEKYVRDNNFKFSHFSEIIKKKFDDAVSDFEDNSIDLLHIDGQHFYEDVSNDFNKWKKKLSDKSVVIFHDTIIKTKNFGVYKFWNEIKNDYPSINFEHSCGLGVIFYGKKYNDKTQDFINCILNKHNNSFVKIFYKKIYESKNYSLPENLIDDAKKLNLFTNSYDLQKNKLKIAVISGDVNNSNFDVRIKKFYNFIQSKTNIHFDYYSDLFIIDEIVNFYDAFVFCRLIHREETLNFIDLLISKKKYLIFDIDDYLIGDIPSFLGHGNLLKDIKPAQDSTKEIIPKFNMVIAATTELKKKLLSYNKNTILLPNGIDQKYILDFKAEENLTSNKITLLLGSTDTVDVSELINPLKIILENNDYILKIIGPISKQILASIPNKNIIFYDIMSYPNFLNFLSKQENAIGLIPLDKSEFSSCKTPIKYINYSASNIPSICSNVKPYNEIIENKLNGFLANNSDEWIKYFHLLKDTNIRKSILMSAKKKITEQFTYDVLLERFTNISKFILNEK